MELLREGGRRPRQVDYISKKDPIIDVWLDSKYTPDCTCCKCGIDGIYNHSLVYRKEVVRVDQTKRNLIFGDVEISLVVIQLGVNRLKKTGFLYLLVVVWRKVGKRGGVI